MSFRPALGPNVPKREWENLSWMDLDGMEGDPRRDIVVAEADQINATFRRLLAAGAVELKDSPLTNAAVALEAIGPDDIASLRRTRLAAAPLTAKNNRLHAHLEVAGIYAGSLTAAVNKAAHMRMPARALHAAGEMNDFGKLTGVFRYHFNDVVGDAMLDDLRIRPDVRKLFMPTEFHVGPVSADKHMSVGERDDWVREYCDAIYDSLTTEQKIFIYADVCGKATGTKLDDIETFDGMRTTHVKSRASGTAYQQYIGAKEPVWPSEIYAIKHIEGFADGWMSIYERIKAEFETMGVDLEAVRQETKAIWLAGKGPERHALAA